MKDKISDFFGNISERARSPFIFSFTISWLLTNWKVWVLLLFYSNDEIFINFNQNKINYIEDLLKNTNKVLVIPLICATGYVIIFKIIYRLLDGLIYRSGNWLYKYGSKKSMVPIETLLSNKNDYEKKIEELSIHLKEQTERQAKISVLNTTIEQKDREIKKYLSEKNASEILDFTWDVIFETYNFEFPSFIKKIENKRIRFNNETVYTISGSDDRYGTIEFLRHKISSKKIIFIMELNTPNQYSPCVWNLEYEFDTNVISGNINGKYNFRLQKVIY